MLTPVVRVRVQPVLRTSRAKRCAQLTVIDCGLAAYHVGLFPKLLGRLGKLVLQQERVDAFEKITRHRAFLRHLQHAGKEMNAAVAGERTCMRRMTPFFSVRRFLLRTSTVFFKMKYICSSISWSYVANIYWNSLTSPTFVFVERPIQSRNILASIMHN